MNRARDQAQLVADQHSELHTALINILGSENVLSNAESRQRYGFACGAPEVLPTFIVLPTGREELRGVILIAQKFSRHLYTISRGKNWGYGGTAPVRSDCILVDLSLMNKICEVNEQLAYAVIEPGVTQGMLYSYLEERHIPLMLDVSSSSIDASLVGNLLERGFGHTPYADHFEHCCSLEVMLADGSIVQTGFGHFTGAKARHCHRWGVGPYLDGIFSQSNFGIVIQATIWLMPKPESQGVFILEVDDDTALLPVMDSLRNLKLNRILNGAVHVINDLRLISTLQGYPFKETGGVTPLPQAQLEKLKKKWGVSSWNILGGMWGSQRHVAADTAAIRKELKGKGKITTLSSTQLKRAERFPALAYILGVRELKKKQAIFRLLRGIPTNSALESAYWRKRDVGNTSTYSNPSEDVCGILWYAPVIPAEPMAITEFLTVSRAVFRHYGFEYTVSFNFTTPRSCSCTLGILFDPHIQNEADNANRCHATLCRELARCGFYPYRLGSNCNDIEANLYATDDPYLALCKKIKDTIDPGRIFSPGRYNI